MSKKKTQLEALRKDLAFLMDDINYKLEDALLRLGDLIEKEDEFSLSILKSIRRMPKKRRELIAKYIQAVDLRDKEFMKAVEDSWGLDEEDFEDSLEWLLKQELKPPDKK
ncbi:hypothetical protein AT15_01750 [Kosmotoga arenicorallina S304]|uniref:Uncharacterized protein n=1 Tax=Kosmotoga arenicorallina S304 TaxID=1453497 RepID=A0A176JZC9_9BACT|nr:hypothetical protein [Kosmotoga arenicorallina]OAA29425.1 hypothetical protein AT15_01750 [Kosmotoga arenicorallina S304]